MTLFRVDWSKDLFFSFFLTNEPVRTYPVHGGLRSSSIGFDRVSTRAVRVLSRARLKIRSEWNDVPEAGSSKYMRMLARAIQLFVDIVSFRLLFIMHVKDLTEENSTILRSQL